MKTPQRILIADDEVRVRRSIATYLTDLGNIVTQASDGREAVAILAEADFDRVFADLMMPYFDGCQVINWVRRHPTKWNSWIALMTANADSFDGFTRELIGADKYVMKPIILKDLLSEEDEP